MRKILRVIIICLFMILPHNLKCQVSSTIANVGIDAKVIAPITIENPSSTNLDFGTVARSSVAGSVTISPQGLRTSQNGAAVITSSLFSAAPIIVNGENNAGYNVILPSSDVKLTRTGGAEEMEVSNFTHNATMVLSSIGSGSFSVGATLNLDADQVAGDYTGSFSITVAYQ